MKVLLEAWARSYFDPAPSTWTLRRMARDGEILPAPVKIGRSWYVDKDARHVSDAGRGSLVERMRAGR